MNAQKNFKRTPRPCLKRRRVARWAWIILLNINLLGAIGQAIATLHGDRARAARLGEAGYERARTITWDGVIERLVGG